MADSDAAWRSFKHFGRALIRLLPLIVLLVLFYRATRAQGDVLLIRWGSTESAAAWLHGEGLTGGSIDASRDDQPRFAWHVWEPVTALDAYHSLDELSDWRKAWAGAVVQHRNVNNATAPASYISGFTVVTLPPWLLALFAALPLFGPVRRWRRGRLRSAKGLCMNCGYDLRGSCGACPECGTSRQPRATDVPGVASVRG